MAEIGLQGARIVPLVGQRVAAGVPEHVGVGLEAKLGLSARPLDHAGEASGAEGRSSLQVNTNGRLGLLLALEPPQGA